MKRLLSIPAVVLAVVLVFGPATARGDSPRWGVTLAGGVSAFLHSQSFALGHLTRPVLKLQIDYDAFPRIRTGVELSAVPSSQGYRLIGGYATVAAAVYRGSIYRFELVSGVGAGTSPAILSHDLGVSHGAAVWVQMGMRHRWSVSERLVVGIDLVDEHLTVLTAIGAVGLRF